MSALEDLLLLQIRQDRHPTPEREFRFDPSRDWRADVAWPDRMVLVEVEGGTGKRIRGRHMRPEGFEDDVEKYNTAALLGFCLIRCTGAMIHDGRAREWVKKALKAHPPTP